MTFLVEMNTYYIVYILQNINMYVIGKHKSEKGKPRSMHVTVVTKYRIQGMDAGFSLCKFSEGIILIVINKIISPFKS